MVKEITCKYDPNDPSVEPIAGGLDQTDNDMASNNLMKESGGQIQQGKENSDGTVSCYGASVSLKDNLNSLLKQEKNCRQCGWDYGRIPVRIFYFDVSGWCSPPTSATG